MIDRETVATLIFDIVGIIGIVAIIVFAVKCSNDKDISGWNNGYCECDNGTHKNRIIAWQPLPEPYMKGGTEE